MIVCVLCFVMTYSVMHFYVVWSGAAAEFQHTWMRNWLLGTDLGLQDSNEQMFTNNTYCMLINTIYTQ